MKCLIILSSMITICATASAFPEVTTGSRSCEGTVEQCKTPWIRTEAVAPAGWRENRELGRANGVVVFVPLDDEKFGHAYIYLRASANPENRELAQVAKESQASIASREDVTFVEIGKSTISGWKKDAIGFDILPGGKNAVNPERVVLFKDKDRAGHDYIVAATINIPRINEVERVIPTLTSIVGSIEDKTDKKQ